MVQLESIAKNGRTARRAGAATEGSERGDAKVQVIPVLESVACYDCGASSASDEEDYLRGQDDLTGKPGLFRYVRCLKCGLVRQNPRVPLEAIGAYYDDEYIAHRKKTDWGPFTPFYEWSMERHDRAKFGIVSRYVTLVAGSRVLDVGCATGSFLAYIAKKTGCAVEGVDFKGLGEQNRSKGIAFHQGLFYEQPLPSSAFDLVTMWHFLEHDYAPRKSLATARRILKETGHLIVEVPRLDSVSRRVFGSRWPGVQAPQHTVLFDKEHFIAMAESEGFEVVEYLPWGAFPAYFYFFAGALFLKNRGKGVDFDKVLVPYALGQLATLPIFSFEKKLNLAMQTLVLRPKGSEATRRGMEHDLGRS